MTARRKRVRRTELPTDNEGNMSTEEQEQTPYRGYGHDLDTMIDAAKRWLAEHRGGQVPKLRWDDHDGSREVLIIGSLASFIETIAMNAAGSAFLKAIDAAVDGRATCIMAQTAHHEAMRADAS